MIRPVDGPRRHVGSSVQRERDLSPDFRHFRKRRSLSACGLSMPPLPNASELARLILFHSSTRKETNMRALMRPLIAAIFGGAWLLTLPVAFAQVQSPAPGLSEPSPNIPDQKLDAAAAAVQRVEDRWLRASVHGRRRGSSDGGGEPTARVEVSPPLRRRRCLRCTYRRPGCVAPA